ncbi:MAG: phosphoglucomutase/phosphomannomutase family protein [Dehalococcoidales bacterium]|nr:phosphoglucomutase/phosphomannomutase family protein [Dehalococcoidales bacterium]
MKNEITFGTDGWRGIIARDFTFANVLVCAQGVADYLKQSGMTRQGLIIGYDTRFASEDFAAAAAEVMAANGIKTYLCDKATPTPVVSYGVLARRAAGAIIITASHNPGIWNGFKYKDQHGASAPDDVTADILKSIDRILAKGKPEQMPLEKALEQGLVARTDLAKVYLEQVARLVDLPAIRKAGLNIKIDSMYGAGAGYLKGILEGGRTRVTELNGERNPLFPGMVRPEPIAVNLKRLSALIREEGASVGLATDGDADRVGIIDEKGNFITQLQTFALLCLYLLEVRGEKGPLVKTLTSSSMIDRLGELYGVPVFETTVGFKYVAPIMLKEDAIIGGEESGGYGFRGHVAERDGILAGLYFLDFMLRTGKKPSELLAYLYSKVGPHYYQRIDDEFPEAERQTIINRLRDNPPESIEDVKVNKIDTADGFRYLLADNSWLLIRFSGTEPVLRIYAESSSDAKVKKLLESGKKLAGVK